MRIRTHKKQFTVISNETSQTSDLSFESLGLLTYCLSMPGDWDFNPKAIAKQRRCCKDKIYRLFKELISQFRCIRYQKNQDHHKKTFEGIEYEIFDDQEDCKKRIAELLTLGLTVEHGVLKECLPRPDFPDTEKPDPENQDITKETSFPLGKEEQKKECITKVPKGPSPSADALELSEHFLSGILEKQPSFKQPNLEKWAVEFDKMLRLDKREVKEAKALMDFVRKGKSHPYVMSAEKFRKLYDENFAHMEAGKDDEQIRENIATFKLTQQKYPEDCKAFSFDKNYIKNNRNGNEISLKCDTESFKSQLRHHLQVNRG